MSKRKGNKENNIKTEGETKKEKYSDINSYIAQIL